MMIREAKQEVYFVISRNEKSHSLHLFCDSSFVGLESSARTGEAMTKEYFFTFFNHLHTTSYLEEYDY
jgi:hypothetical protein